MARAVLISKPPPLEKSQRKKFTIPTVPGESCLRPLLIRVRLFCVELILTEIASDAFAGGFCAGIVQGKTLDESIDMGHWLANLSIRELGPQ